MKKERDRHSLGGDRPSGDRPSLAAAAALREESLFLPANTRLGVAYDLMRRDGAEEVLVMPSAWRPPEEPVAPIGILTFREAKGRLGDAETNRTTLASVMSHPVQTVEATAEVDQALMLMEALRVHRLPVVSQGRVLGLLTRDSVLAAQRQQLQSLADEAARLEEQALRDPLTGLANRRLFDAVLEREISLYRRTGRPVGLLMIDIDHFKVINDAHGHPRGDEVLRELGRRLLGTVRRVDLVARVGGEEFAVIATGSEHEEIDSLAEKLRRVVENDPFDGDPPLELTISVGGALATWRAGPRELICRADAALYGAKRAGRNAVRMV